MKNTAQGFTLIELLIVIAIIGILAAVLIPNLLGARTRAYDTASASCAKEIQTKEEMLQIDTRAYGATAALTGDYLPKCDKDVTWSVTVTAASGTTPETYTGTVKHAQGKKTYTVTPNSLSGS